MWMWPNPDHPYKMLGLGSLLVDCFIYIYINYIYNYFVISFKLFHYFIIVFKSQISKIGKIK